jgi:hypothetical protein
LDEIRLAWVGLRVEALGLATTVAGVCIALAARLTPANEADSDLAPRLLEELPEEARFVLGDTHYNAPEVRELCEGRDRILVGGTEKLLPGRCREGSTGGSRGEQRYHSNRQHRP